MTDDGTDRNAFDAPTRLVLEAAARLRTWLAKPAGEPLDDEVAATARELVGVTLNALARVAQLLEPPPDHEADAAMLERTREALFGRAEPRTLPARVFGYGTEPGEVDDAELTVDRIGEQELRIRAWSPGDEGPLERAALYLDIGDLDEFIRRLRQARDEPPRVDPHWSRP